MINLPDSFRNKSRILVVLDDSVDTKTDKLDWYRILFIVKNTGSVPGKEIAEVYVSNPGCKVERPARELKQFTKLDLQPGESKQVSLNLNKRAFQYYDVKQKNWVAAPGKFEIQVGASSRDISFKEDVELK